MSIQPDELVFIVDETHEDKKCGRESIDCPKQAVWNVEWTQCCNRTYSLCLTCHDHLKSCRASLRSGTLEAICQRHGGIIVAKRVYPVERS